MFVVMYVALFLVGMLGLIIGLVLLIIDVKNKNPDRKTAHILILTSIVILLFWQGIPEPEKATDQMNVEQGVDAVND